jgi:hypothetical protein
MQHSQSPKIAAVRSMMPDNMRNRQWFPSVVVRDLKWSCRGRKSSPDDTLPPGLPAARRRDGLVAATGVDLIPLGTKRS